MEAMANSAVRSDLGAHRPPLWFGFLRETAAKMQRDDYHRGLSYTTDPRASTRDAVSDYMQAFGFGKVGITELVSVLHRDRRGIQRAAAELVASGELTVSEQTTMGKQSATPRKVYSNTSRNSAIPRSLSHDVYGKDKFRDHWNREADQYFDGTIDAEEVPGRQVPPRYVEYEY